MVDSHSKIFFGQNTGLILSSSSKYDPFIFIQCIKKKPNETWEKPSENEGKIIKFSLEEIVMILRVLNRRSLNWQSYHSYKGNQTSLSFSWEDESSETLWINIADYSKMLNPSQTEILRLLLAHLLKEKLIYATSSKIKGPNQKYKNSLRTHSRENIDREIDSDEQELERNLTFIEEFAEYPLTGNDKNRLNKMSKEDILKSKCKINGMIAGETEKAILINFELGKEAWIPKSTIHSQYEPRKNLSQKFLIDNWILKRNNIIL